jgi:hypothetical protein
LINGSKVYLNLIGGYQLVGSCPSPELDDLLLHTSALLTPEKAISAAAEERLNKVFLVVGLFDSHGEDEYQRRGLRYVVGCELADFTWRAMNPENRIRFVAESVAKLIEILQDISNIRATGGVSAQKVIEYLGVIESNLRIGLEQGEKNTVESPKADCRIAARLRTNIIPLILLVNTILLFFVSLQLLQLTGDMDRRVPHHTLPKPDRDSRSK